MISATRVAMVVMEDMVTVVTAISAVVAADLAEVPADLAAVLALADLALALVDLAQVADLAPAATLEMVMASQAPESWSTKESLRPAA